MKRRSFIKGLVGASAALAVGWSRVPAPHRCDVYSGQRDWGDYGLPHHIGTRNMELLQRMRNQAQQDHLRAMQFSRGRKAGE